MERTLTYPKGSIQAPETHCRPTHRRLRPLLVGLAFLLAAAGAQAQDVVDRFNRANSNTVGGGWTQTETGAAGASINGSRLRLQRTGSGNNRQYVTQNTPGSYSTTLDQNNCTLTWAFSFRQSETETELSGFDPGEDGMAVVLAGSNANLTLGQGYAVVLGEGGNTDRVRLVRYNGGLDLDNNLTTIIQAGNFDNDYLDVRVTYVPSTNTWSLFYRDNGNTQFGNPLTAATSAGSAVDATYTGTSLPVIGCLWNHDGDFAESAVFDDFHVPGGSPTVPAITPPSASICNGGNVDLTASATSASTARVTFTSTGGPSTVGASGANDGSVYPWAVSVSGLPASGVTVESVTLNGITHTYPDDLDILLQAPTGTNVILMSDVGGDPNITGVNVVLMDGEPALPDASSIASGVYAPTNIGTPDTWPSAPGPGSFNQSNPTLSLFTGNFNGTWNLLIRDDANGDGGSVGSWSITFTYTPQATFTWSPATGLSGTSGATVTASPTSTQTYTVTAAHAANGCTSSNTVEVTVTPQPTVANAGADMDACLHESTATMAANTPTSGSGAWTQVSGPVSASFADAASPSTAISGLTAPGAYVFRWTITNAPCTESFDEVTVNVAICTYYSRSSGAVTDAVWSLTPSGAAGPATFSSITGMVVQAGHTVNAAADADVHDLTVANGGTLILNGGATLTVNGAAATFNGTLTAQDNSELAFAGSGAKTLTLASSTSFWDLTVDAPDGLDVDGTVEMRGTLLLEDGAFDCTGNPVIMRSTASYTGRLGPVGGTASYTGHMRMERYIPAGATNWRLLGSPIQSRRVNHWIDDFYTAGFPGSHFPGFTQNGNPWPSIRWYDETNTGASVNNGMTGVSSNTQLLTPGQGFAAWCGDNLISTAAFTIDLENQSPVIASTPITLPMTYTNTGNPAVDGWNLVANPLPSPIAFDQIARGADVADYVTFFNPAAGNMATWDIDLNAGTNGGTNTIQSMQGFYLKAEGPAVTTTVEEADKVADNAGGFFGGSEETPALVRLRITSGINSFSDETLLLFTQGTHEMDAQDVPKYVFGHPQAPQVATLTSTGTPLAINAFGPFSSAVEVPVAVQAGAAGTYTITVTGVETVGLSCLRLHDLVTGTTIPLAEGSTYTLELPAGEAMSTPRLLLMATAPLEVAATDAACHGQSSGSAQVVIADGAADVIWYNDQGQPIATQTAVTGTVALEGLAMGDYELTVNGYQGCSELRTAFRIEQPEALAVQTEGIAASCPGASDGFAEAFAMGGTAPYAYLWSNGSTDASMPAGPGLYTVQVTDAAGCSTPVEQVVVGAGEAPVAIAMADAEVVPVGAPVAFVSAGTDATSHAWDFGDGSTSTEEAPVHSFAAPGTYAVTLTVSNGTCSSTAVVNVTVELSTGISGADSAADRLSAWFDGDRIVVEHGFTDAYPLQLEVINEAGQTWMQHRVAGPAGRMTLPGNDLASGVWFIRVSSDEVRRTIPLVIVR
jgi:subtilisin-like proprotein convertase family protein